MDGISRSSIFYSKKWLKIDPPQSFYGLYYIQHIKLDPPVLDDHPPAYKYKGLKCTFLFNISQNAAPGGAVWRWRWFTEYQLRMLHSRLYGHICCDQCSPTKPSKQNTDNTCLMSPSCAQLTNNWKHLRIIINGESPEQLNQNNCWDQ